MVQIFFMFGAWFERFVTVVSIVGAVLLITYFALVLWEDLRETLQERR